MTRLAFIWIAAAAVLLLMLGFSLPASLAARSQAHSAGLQLTSTARDAEAIRTLKSSMPPESSDEPAGGLTQRISASLARTGLPAAALAGLSPEAESPLVTQPGVRAARRRTTLTLAGIALPQIGRFLDDWRTTEPAWIPVSIDLAPMGGKPPEAGGDLPLRGVIVLEFTSIRYDGVPQ